MQINRNQVLLIIFFQIPQLNYGRKMPGCTKTIYNSKMSLVVAGGQDSTGNKLKSVEMISIDIEKQSTPLTWTILGELKYARSHFPSVGTLGVVSLRSIRVTYRTRAKFTRGLYNIFAF